jgi:hypothetical protein
MFEAQNVDRAQNIVMAGLVAAERGEPYDEDEMLYASCFMMVASLVSQGVEVDTAVEAVQQAADLHITFSEAEGLSITIGA